MLATGDVDPARLRVFQAALTQAEELWEAAAAVGAASRPLPLFYCLSQAGRAICAAWTVSPDWQPDTHGITSRGAGGASVADLEVTVTKAKHGMFPMVAEATDSPTFKGPVSVAHLWASLPDLPSADELTGEAPKPLYLEQAQSPPGEEDPFFGFLSPKYATLAWPRPKRLEEALGNPLTGEASGESLSEALSDYPSALGIEAHEVYRTWIGKPTKENIYSFPDDKGEKRSLWQVGERMPTNTSSALRSERFVVRPRIGSGDELPSQLMTLWALLYALSQLARYHPDLWIAALNPDTSKIAVDLEHGLDAALTLVPDLLVPAITNGMLPRLRREALAKERAEKEA